jgi:hypothetical protein
MRDRGHASRVGRPRTSLADLLLPVRAAPWGMQRPVIRFRPATRQNRCGARSRIDTEGRHMNGLGYRCGSVFALLLAGSVWNGED